MDLRNKLIGLACDNRASGATTLQIRVPSTLSQSPAKVKGRPSFMAVANGSLGLAVFQSIEIPSHLSLPAFEFSGVYLMT